jgi:hypothetical protein
MTGLYYHKSVMPSGLQPCLPERFLLVCLDRTWRSSKMAKEILCGFGIDVDAVAGWLTIHPDVSGRPHVLMMLERLYHHMIGHPGVRFATMNEMADDFVRRSPRKKG